MKPERTSATATVIAAAARDAPDAVSRDEAVRCDRFLAQTAYGRRCSRVLASAPGRCSLRLPERLVLPGIRAHYRNRKRRIETLCREAIAEGFGRVVVFGAGFDTLALRLSREFPAVEFLESDLPGIQNAKRRAEAASPDGPSCRVRFVSSLQSLPDDGRATCAIFEAVPMYMTPADVSALFFRLGEARPAALRVIFTHMTVRTSGEPEFRPRGRLVGRWLRAKGEPFRWSLADDEAEAFPARRGFGLRRYYRTREIALVPDAVSGLRGENPVLADRVSPASP